MDCVTEPTSDARPAVAVAVITSDLGVLIGRRRDGNPPWTFPGGKIETGEDPENAAVREVLEETGLQIQATGIIGSRVHPMTGVRMVYVAAELAGEPGVMAGKSGELAEVRWASLAEARERMGGMSEAVRQYLPRMLDDA